jgi:hypothetical protein
MNKKMDTLNSTIETLQSQVTGLRSVVRQQSEQIATLTKPQPASIPPRFNHNFQTYPYNRYNRYNLEEISWLEFVVTIFHSAAGCELSIFESVPKICGKMSRESVGSDSLSFKII